MERPDGVPAYRTLSGRNHRPYRRRAGDERVSRKVQSQGTWTGQAGQVQVDGASDHIRSHFNEESFTEIGEKLGVTRVTVSRIASKMGLKRSKHEGYKVSSRVRQKMVRRERRRMVFGLDPITRINVISNRAKVRLRYRLKVKGYILSGQKNLMYYTENTFRKQRLENRGMKLGIRFQPVPQEDIIVIPNLI